MPRLFFAIPIPFELRQKLVRGFPKEKFHDIRFTPIENLHITIHFLGTTAEEKFERLIQSTTTLIASTSSFEMRFDCFKIIMKERKPIMIWAQFEESGAFEKLALQLREAFPTEEKRKPNPHATLARIKQLKRLPFELPEAKPFSFVVDRLELWESKLSSEGSRYLMLQSWKLS